MQVQNFNFDSPIRKTAGNLNGFLREGAVGSTRTRLLALSTLPAPVAHRNCRRKNYATIRFISRRRGALPPPLEVR